MVPVFKLINQDFSATTVMQKQWFITLWLWIGFNKSSCLELSRGSCSNKGCERGLPFPPQPCWNDWKAPALQCISAGTSARPSHWTWAWIHSSLSEFSFSRTPSLTWEHNSSARSRASRRLLWSGWFSGVFSRIWHGSKRGEDKIKTEVSTGTCQRNSHKGTSFYLGFAMEIKLKAFTYKTWLGVLTLFMSRG